jgi:2-keto-4-pentenoate hydratase
VPISLTPAQLDVVEYVVGHRIKKEPLRWFTGDGAPQTFEEAYSMQAAARERLAGELGDPVGYKIGYTSKVMQEVSGIDHPVAGTIYASGVVESPAHISRSDYLEVGAETEFAARLRRDLPPGRTYTFEDIVDAVDEVYPALEIAENRWEMLEGTSALNQIVDDVLGAGMVLGEAIDDWENFDLAGCQVALYFNDEFQQTAVGADLLGHPLKPLVWLANSPVTGDRGLRAGEYVCLGAVIPNSWVEAGDQVRATYQGASQVQLDFV